MNFLRRKLQKELTYYHKLTPDGKKLILSIIFYNIADPLLWLFVNTYIYRSSHDMKILAIYNGAVFAGLPIGYYINGKFLSKFLPSTLAAVGAISTGLVAFLIIIFTPTSFAAILFFGLLFGATGGLYWANRNFLNLRSTTSDHRIYFSSIEATSGTLIGIVVPFVVGWFLVLGQQHNWYSLRQGYLVMAIVALLIMVCVGWLMREIHPFKQQIPRIVLKNKSERWNLVRLFTYISGIFGGTELFLPILMVLVIVGYENVLGTIQSAATIISAIAVYGIAKRAKKNDEFKLISVSIVTALVGALSFGILYSVVGVLLFYIFDSFTGTFRWVGSSPLVNNTIDAEEKITKIHHYAYIFDQELFLNLGRLTAISFFIVGFTFYPSITFRFMALALAITQIGLYFSAKKLRRFHGEISVNG